MKKITPTETFRNALRRAPLFEKLPTAFRVSHGISMQVELSNLLTRLHGEHGINISKEVEPLIKRWAAKTARKLNENRS